MKKEWYTYENEITGELTKVNMTKGTLSTWWEVTSSKKYSPIVVFNPWDTKGVRKTYAYKMPIRVWNKNYDRAMEGIVKMAVMVYQYYTGRNSKEYWVNRDKHENKFNPIFKWEIDGQLYIVEWHSRAEYIELRKANQLCYKMYKTRVLYRTEGCVIEKEEQKVWHFGDCGNGTNLKNETNC